MLIPTVVRRAVELYATYGAMRYCDAHYKGGVFEMPRTADQDRLLGALPADGTFVTNKKIREQLNLSDNRYWEVRNQLLKEGKLILGLGYGGRVALKIDTTAKPPSAKERAEQIDEIREEAVEESTLYVPFADEIRKRSKDEGFEQTIVQVTAWAGARDTGGPWSRPDVCRVSIRNLIYLGQKAVEVTTFEIKSFICDVQGVYEALAHSRRAHRSYLALYKKGNLDEKVAERLGRVETECARTGIGLIIFTDPKNFETYETRVEPRANPVDLSEVNEFIAREIKDRDQILKWL